MSRSMWKLPYIQKDFFSKHVKEMKTVRLEKRNTSIPKNFIEKGLNIHNGKTLNYMVVTNKTIGRKAGEFSITKSLGQLESKKKKLKKKEKLQKEKGKKQGKKK